LIVIVFSMIHCNYTATLWYTAITQWWLPCSTNKSFQIFFWQCRNYGHSDTWNKKWLEYWSDNILFSRGDGIYPANFLTSNTSTVSEKFLVSYINKSQKKCSVNLIARRLLLFLSIFLKATATPPWGALHYLIPSSP
jgi:hypothetical protein